MPLQLRTTLGLILCLALLGCSAQQARNEVPRPDSPYCLRGGDAESFSCDPGQQGEYEPPADSPKATATVEDDALYAELADIKNWLNSEKTVHAETPDLDDESDVVLPPPVEPAPVADPPPAPPPLPPLLADAPYRKTLDEAASLHEQGYYQHAQDELRQLIELYPQRPEAYNNLGVMLAQTGQFSEAIGELQQALATHPHYARIHSNLRKLYGALAGNTYSDALGQRRNRPAPELKTLAASPDADSLESIGSQIGTRLETWTLSPAQDAKARAALYIPGFRPDSQTTHAQWLQSLATPGKALHLQAYELAIMAPDWVEVTLQAAPQPPQDGKPVLRSLSLIRIDSTWLISVEQDLN